MSARKPTYDDRKPTYEELTQQLAEAKWVFDALRSGEIDAVVSERDVALLRARKLETELRRSEENFRRSLDGSPLGVRIITSDGETTYANRAMLDIYGYDSIEELRTTPPQKRYTPESYAEHQVRKEKNQRGEYVPSNYEINIVRKDGEVRCLEIFRKEALWNGKTQFQILYSDITERKRAEKQLIHLASFAQLNPNPIIEITLNGYLSYVNPAAKSLLTDIEKLGVKHPYLNGWVDMAEQLKKAPATPITREVRVDERDFIQTVQYLEQQHSLRFYGIDITERKRAEEMLREKESRFSDIAENASE
ncbi:MAG: PAS domain S-box protein [Dehalococcoidales bacterium]|nr:PAS domain S-box protein [Dehalococcoidales bacterium]